MYVIQNIKTSKFIITENPLDYTVHYDNALLFKETVVDQKLKKYPNHKKIMYHSLGRAVTRY